LDQSNDFKSLKAFRAVEDFSDGFESRRRSFDCEDAALLPAEMTLAGLTGAAAVTICDN
jgi:hypothetical protein